MRFAQAKAAKSGVKSTASLFELLAQAGMYYAPPEGGSAATISREMTVMSWKMYSWERDYSLSEEEEEEAFRRSSLTRAGAAVLETVEAALKAAGAEPANAPFEISVMTSLSGRVTKRITRAEDGKITNESGGAMSKGIARRS